MAAIAAANIQSPLPGEALDIGSGKGELIGAIRARFGLRTTACDYTDTLMNDSTQRVDIVDLNAGKLPYSDSRFCLVTCVETIDTSNKRVLYCAKSIACSSPVGSRLLPLPIS